MTRGNVQLTKVHYKGAEDDFIIFVESPEIVTKWKGDKTVPLSDVVSGWKVFVTQRHGTQGILNEASNGSLDNEFGTHTDDDVIKAILEKGSVQEYESPERQGDRNITNGGMVAH